MKKIFVVFIIFIIASFTSCVMDGLEKDFGFFVENQTEDTIFVFWGICYNYEDSNASLKSLYDWNYTERILPHEVGAFTEGMDEGFDRGFYFFNVYIFRKKTKEENSVNEIKEYNRYDMLYRLIYPEFKALGFWLVYDGKNKNDVNENEE